jgi:hypothetical protein
MNTPTGKGIFIWKAKNCETGELDDIVQACSSLGLKWVALKIGDGNFSAYASFTDMIGAAAAFKAAGMAVWGWHYVRGGCWIDKNGAVHTDIASPEKEAEFARAKCALFGLDGYIIDAEREYKVGPDPRDRARRFIKALMGINIPIALCSYRFPAVHPEFPWYDFLDGCDLIMPQDYWGPGGATSELEQSMQQYRVNAQCELPTVPVGRAYIGDGHPDPKPEEIMAFMGKAQDLGCPGCSFWALDFLYLHTGGPGRGEAIARYAWDNTPEPIEQGIYMRVLAEAMNVRSGPGTNYPVVGSLKRGMTVEAMDVGGYNCWARIGPGRWAAVNTGGKRYMEVKR